MSHFAQIENGLVVQVLVGDNSLPDEGQSWFNENLGGTWIKTSFNTREGKHLNNGTPLRKNFAGIGDTYDANRDAFYAPQPFPSWVLNEDTCIWEAPTPRPIDGKEYVWNEITKSWVAND